MPKQHDFQRFFPNGGRRLTKNHKNWRSGINFLMRFQRYVLRLQVQDWIKRSLTFVGVLGSPRNKKKSGWARFGLLHFYPEIFYYISSFIKFVSKLSYSGIRYILSLAQTRDRMEFRGPGLTPKLETIPKHLTSVITHYTRESPTSRPLLGSSRHLGR